jgi:hypothetical protein
MADFKDLSLPEQIVVQRISLDEPLIVVNAWLSFNNFKQLTSEDLDRLKIKHGEIIKAIRSDTGSDAIFKELIDLKDLLINLSSSTKDPKAVAQLSNSINAVSKTISDSIEKKKSEKDEVRASPQEFLGVLSFLKSEGFIDYSEDKINELRRHLFGTISTK